MRILLDGRVIVVPHVNKQLDAGSLLLVSGWKKLLILVQLILANKTKKVMSATVIY